MNITLERLAYSDINLLRELRNANADSFFDDTYITREMQQDWWYRYGHDSSMGDFYTIWLNKVTPVGFLSVKTVVDVFYGENSDNLGICEIGNLLLAPCHRGRGIMTMALIEVRRLYDPLTFWIARVKPNNTASLRLFERAGFWIAEPVKGKRKCRRRLSSTPMPPIIGRA